MKEGGNTLTHRGCDRRTRTSTSENTAILVREFEPLPRFQDLMFHNLNSIKMKEKMIKAQASLMARASVLMMTSKDVQVWTSCHPNIGLFRFEFGDLVSLDFDDENPYDEQQVSAAIKALDDAIELAYERAQNTIQFIKAWRG